MSDMHENEIARAIVDSAYKIHRSLGPGLLESAYAKTMIYELRTRGLFVARQPRIPILYESICIDESFRADLIVEEKVIVELKSIEAIAAVHYKQLLTYLRLSGLHLGLLINLNVELIKDGIKRVVNNLEE
jgi:GxxExxY protein